MAQTFRPDWWPEWFTGKTINEPLFFKSVLDNYRLAYTENSFFSPNGKVTDENALRSVIYQMIEPFVTTNVSKKVDDIMRDLRIKAQVKELLPQTDRIHLKNGTLFLNGSFIDAKDEIVRCRFPVCYNPDAKPPERWLRFLSELFYPEDIPAVQ